MAKGLEGFNKDPNKPHVGRKAGVKNKASLYNKAFVQELLNNHSENIEGALQTLLEKDPDAYLRHIKEFMKFVMPQVSAVKIEDMTDDRKVSISLDLHSALEELNKK